MPFTRPSRWTNTMLTAGLLLCISLSVVRIAAATTPNPGHPWTEVGDGVFAVTGPTVLRTYTYPDASATILTSNAAVTVAQGGTGAATLTGVLIGNGTSAITGTSILTAANGGTGNGFASFSGPTTSTKTFTLPDASATILTSNAAVTVAQGGTGLATLTANNVILGNGTSTPSFVAPSTSGNVLQSNGTTWVSTAQPSLAVVVNRPVMATGATAAVAQASLTAYKVGLFNAPEAMTINQIAYNVGAVTTAGTYRFCVYSEDGATKLVDVTDVPAAGVNTVSVSAVTLAPGNYYLAFGCATTCSNTVTTWTTTATAWINGASVPASKKIHEGTATMTSGTCNTTLPTITGGNSVVPVVRLDN